MPRARLVLAEARLVERQLQLDSWPCMPDNQLSERLAHTVPMLLAHFVHAVIRQVKFVELLCILARLYHGRCIRTQERRRLLAKRFLVFENHLGIVHVHNKTVKALKAARRVPDNTREP